MITTDLTLTNGVTSETPIRVVGITFEVDSKLAVNPSVVFPLDVAIDSSEIIGIDFDETLYTGDYTESITINTLGGRNDIVHSVTIDDTTYIESPNVIYALTESLGDDGGYKFVIDSGVNGINGYLEDSGGEVYLPTSLQYPEDGTVELLDGKVINTRQTISPTTECTIMYAYEVVVGASFKLAAAHYKGDGTADIYEASESSAWSQIGFDVPFTIEDPFKIYETPVVPTESLGEEKISNGTFDTTTDPWASSTAMLTIDTQRMRIEKTTADSNETATYDLDGTMLGLTYRVSVDVVIGTADRVVMYTNGEGWQSDILADGHYEYDVVIEDWESLRIYIYGALGGYAIVDNVSVREIL